jgi:hypothetical protein
LPFLTGVIFPKEVEKRVSLKLRELLFVCDSLRCRLCKDSMVIDAARVVLLFAFLTACNQTTASDEKFTEDSF